MMIIILVNTALSIPPVSAINTPEAKEALESTYIILLDNTLYIGNKFIQIGFSTKDGSVQSIHNKIVNKSVEFVKAPKGGLFQLHIDTPPIGWIDSGSANTFNYYYFESSEHSYILFKSIYNSLMQDKISVEVKVEVYGNSSLTHWSLKVETGEAIIIDEIIFPNIRGILSYGTDSTDDYIIVPDDFGSMLLNPLYTLTLNNSKSPCFSSGNYPSFGGVLQLSVFGDEDGGLYIATHDPTGAVKSFALCKDVQNGALELIIRHLQPLIERSLIELPYEVVIASFKGTWHLAADMYRSWAETQWWTKRGPISYREDIPDWIKRGFTYVNIGSYVTGVNYSIEAGTVFSEVPIKVETLKGIINAPYVIEWGGWEKHGYWVSPESFPPAEGWDKFKEVINQLHKMGVKVLVSLSAGPINIDSPNVDPRWKDCEILKKDGSPVRFYDRYGTIGYASPTCSLFEEWLINATLTLAKAGVDGVRLDAMFFDPFDFREGSGHPPGYGSWWAEARINTYEKIYKLTKKINPHFILGNEHLPELFIPYNVFYISDVGDIGFNPKLVNFGDNLRITGLFEYVYGDYVIAFPRNDGTLKISEGPKLEKYTFFKYSLNLVNDVIVPSLADTKGIVHVSASYMRDFILMGRRLPPPHLNASLTTVPIHIFVGGIGSLGFKNYSINSIIGGAWILNGERIGFVFINIDSKPGAFQALIDDYYFNQLNGDELVALVIHGNSVEKYHINRENKFFKYGASLEPNGFVAIQILPREMVDEAIEEYLAYNLLYLHSVSIFKLLKLGYNLDKELVLLSGAEKDYLKGNIKESLSKSLNAYVSIAKSFQRFGSLILKHDEYEDIVNKLLDAVRSGDPAIAYKYSIKALEIGLESIYRVSGMLYFDQGHTRRATLNYTEWEGYNPNYVMFTPRVDGAMGFKVIPLVDKINYSLIKNASILVIPAPDKPYSVDEISAILRFVKEGGGLLILGDGHLPDYINKLTKEFGIEVLPHVSVASKKHLWDEFSFYVTQFDKNHPITKDIEIIRVNVMAPVKINPDIALPIAWTDEDTAANDIRGSFPYIVVARYGYGRVVFVADNSPFMDSGAGGPYTLKLLVNILNWLYETNNLGKVVLVDNFIVYDGRIDVGSEAEIYVHAVYASNNSNVADIKLEVNGIDVRLNASGWGLVRLSMKEVGSSSVNIASRDISGTYRIYVIDKHPKIIWDKVIVALYSYDYRVDVNSSAVITYDARYAYDNSTFLGKIFLNDTLTKSMVGRYVFTVDKVIDEKYGLKMYESNSISIIFDLVNITLKVDDEYVLVGAKPDVMATAQYSYDGEKFSGTVILNGSLNQFSPGIFYFTVKEIIDEKYGLRSFRSNTIRIVYYMPKVYVEIPQEVVTGNQLEIVIKILDPKGRPVSNLAVETLVDGELVAREITDNRGIIKISILPEDPGRKIMEVKAIINNKLVTLGSFEFKVTEAPPTASWYILIVTVISIAILMVLIIVYNKLRFVEQQYKGK